jgi:hypothetical protein
MIWQCTCPLFQKKDIGRRLGAEKNDVVSSILD